MFMQKMIPPSPPPGLDEEPPFGSLPEEVADDIPVMLSEGEYVVPADVVRYWGLKHLEEMHTQAKCGLMCMQMDDRLHTVDDDDDAEDDDDDDDNSGADYAGYDDDDNDDDEVVERIEVSAYDVGYGDIDDEMEELGLEDEVDFDGKDGDGDTPPLYMRHGGDVGGHRGGDVSDYMNKSNAFGFEPTSSVSPDVGPPSRDVSDVAQGLVDTARDAATRDATGLQDRMSFDEATRGDFSGLPGTIASTAAGALSPPGMFGVLGSMFGLGPSIQSKDIGIEIKGQSYTMNLGVGLPGVFGQMAAKGLAEIAAKVARNDPTVSKNDIGLVDGQVVGIQRGMVMGVPTASLLGTVPTNMTVQDFTDMQALSLGKVPRTAPVNEYGIPDFGKATDMIGTSTDPADGTTTGYDPATGYAHGPTGVSATNTMTAATHATNAQLRALNVHRSAWNKIDIPAVAALREKMREKEAKDEVAKAAVATQDAKDSDDVNDPYGFGLETSQTVPLSPQELDIDAMPTEPGSVDPDLGKIGFSVMDIVGAQETDAPGWGSVGLPQFSTDVETAPLGPPTAPNLGLSFGKPGSTDDEVAAVEQDRADAEAAENAEATEAAGLGQDSEAQGADAAAAEAQAEAEAMGLTRGGLMGKAHKGGRKRSRGY